MAEARTIQLARMQCCGIAEINGLSIHNDPLKSLQHLEKFLRIGVTWPLTVDHSGEKKGMPFPFITFTGAFKTITPPVYLYAQRFAEFITENDLGTLVTAPEKLNWTGNLIQIWVWAPNYPNIYALLAKHPLPVVRDPALVQTVGENDGVETGETQPTGSGLNPRTT